MCGSGALISLMKIECKNRTTSKVEEPKGPEKYFRDDHVLRGGSFMDNFQIASCTYRRHASPSYTAINIGFKKLAAKFYTRGFLLINKR